MLAGLRCAEESPVVMRENDRIEMDIRLPAPVGRAEAREFLLMRWAKEQAGRKYRYFAEKFADGGRLYLERPGQLNKGCDFVIFLENSFLHKNGNDRPPSHKDLFADLDGKRKSLPPDEWATLMDAIKAEHALSPIPGIGGQITTGSGLDIIRLTALCRWFFLEQDLTYWNLTGRHMLLKAITSHFS